MVVIAIQAAERKVGVYLFLRFHFICIMAGRGHQLMDLVFGDFFLVIHHHQLFGLGIPGCLLDALMVQHGLNARFAHSTIAIDFDLGRDRG